MINWTLIFSPGFWFTTAWNPVTDRTVWFMLTVFALVVVVGVALFILASRSRDGLVARALRRMGAPFLFAGVVGTLWTFFLYEQVPILSARFWFLVLFAGFAVWFGFALRMFFVKVPKIRSAAQSRAAFEQYLPKRRRK